MRHDDVERIIQQWLQEEHGRWLQDLVRRLERQWDEDILQRKADWHQADRWLKHFEPELQTIAGRHGVPLQDVTGFAWRHVRGKVAHARRAVVEEVEALLDRHPLWGAWSPHCRPTFVPGEPVAVEITATVRPDEDVTFTRWRLVDGQASPEGESLDPAAGEQPGEVTVRAALQVGDVVEQSTMKRADREEEWRRMAEWRQQGRDLDRMPDALPSRDVSYVLLPDRHLLRIDEEDKEGQRAVTDHLFEGLPLDGLLARVRGRR